MTVFSYRAKNELGEIVVGTVDAVSEKEAEATLESHQLIPMSLAEQTDIGRAPFGIGSVTVREKALFTRSLAALLEAGLPLVQSLNVVLNQVRNKRLRLVTGNIIHDIEGGISLSKSAEKYPSIFNPIYINMLRSGEATGRLDTVLKDLADQLESDAEFVARIRSAMYYPIFIIFALIVVGAIVMTRIIPQLKEVFLDAGVPLPLATRVLIAVSDYLNQSWYYVIAGFVVLVILGRFASKTPAGRRMINRFSLTMPPFKELSLGVVMTRFTRVTGMLLQAGVPILDTLSIVSDVTGNVLIREGIERSRSEVERGVPLSSALGKEPTFPPLVTQMVAVGESTGRLDEMLLNLSRFFATEVDAQLKGLTSLIEPMIILVLGIGVGFLVFAVIIPIYNISQFA